MSTRNRKTGLEDLPRAPEFLRRLSIACFVYSSSTGSRCKRSEVAEITYGRGPNTARGSAHMVGRVQRTSYRQGPDKLFGGPSSPCFMLSGCVGWQRLCSTIRCMPWAAISISGNVVEPHKCQNAKISRHTSPEHETRLRDG